MSPQQIQPTQQQIDEEVRAFRDSLKDKFSVLSDPSPIMPNLDLAISNATLDRLAADKELVKIDARDVVAAFNGNAQFKQALKDNPGAQLYVVSGAGSPDLPEVQVMHTKEGKPYILVNQAAKWSEDYARSRMRGDADIAGDLATARPEEYVPRTEEGRQRYAELLAYAKQGNAGTQIRIGRDVFLSTVATQTMEGTDFITISQKELDKALSSPEEMEKLKHTLDREKERIKAGDTTPAGEVTRHEAESFMSSGSLDMTYQGRAGFAHLPAKDTPLSDAALDYAARSGKFEQVKVPDMIPSAANDPAIRDAREHNIPIYVMNSDFGTAGPEARLMHTKEGKPFVIVNNQYMPMSLEEARATQKTDAEIAEGIKSKELVKAENLMATLPADMQNSPDVQRRYKEFLQTIKDEAAAKGVDGQVMVDTTGGKWAGNTGACAQSTQEGHGIIVISQDQVMQALRSDEKLQHDLKVTVAHEESHLEMGHTTPQGLIEARKVSNARFHELQAELGATGPLGTIGLDAYVKKEEQMLKNNIHEYNDSHPDAKINEKVATEAQLKQVSQWLVDSNFDAGHHAIWDRIEAAREEARLMKIYESHYGTNDKKREEEWVIKLTAEHMQGKWQEPITDPSKDPDAKPAPEKQAGAPQPHAQLKPADQKKLDEATAQLAHAFGGETAAGPPARRSNAAGQQRS